MDTRPKSRKTVGLVAHDNRKSDLVEWARFNRQVLVAHDLVATGTTGTLLEDQLGVGIVKLQSGPLGGDQQLGAMIAQGEIDVLIFFWDPLEPQPHDPDVRALLRIAVVWNIPVACNRATADFLVSSPLMTSDYERRLPDYQAYIDRSLTWRSGRTTKNGATPARVAPFSYLGAVGQEVDPLRGIPTFGCQGVPSIGRRYRSTP